MMKKLIYALLLMTVVLLCVAILPHTAQAETQNVLKFRLRDNGVSYSVAGWENGSVEELTIPATYNGKPVTGIDGDAFSGCTSLTSITIPDSVTSIGRYAFSGCSGLLSITIPDSVTDICDYAFSSCSRLCSVTIGSGVKWIGSNVFYGCNDLSDVYAKDPSAWCRIQFSDNLMHYAKKLHFIDEKGNELTDIVLDSSVSRIPRYCFYKCRNLTSVTIPDSVISINDYAFSECVGLTSITIPDSVTSIGRDAFYLCTSLSSITIPNSVTRIDAYAFSDCTSLVGITLPAGITSIDYGTFSDCSSLASITLPDGITEIDDSAFYKCTSLESITIPNSVASIGSQAFAYCKLKNVYYAGSQDVWKNIRIDKSFNGHVYLTRATIHYMHIHDYSLIAPTVIAPTCTAVGYTEYTCVFGEKYMTDYVDALGHKTGSNPIVVAPTCTNKGYTTSNCGRCGIEANSDITAALGHNYTGEVKIVGATCESDGWKGASCTRCDSVRKDVTIFSTGHTIVLTDDSMATCTKLGSTGGTHCSACNKVFVAPTTIPMLDHSYTSAVIEPAPGKPGYTLHTCHCGDSYKDTYVAALDVSTPKVTITVDAATGKPDLCWANGGEGVTYEIHQATSKTGKYTKVATVPESSWIDTSAAVGKTYYYKVKAIYAEDTSFNSDFSAVVSATAKCATLVITVENNSSGKPVISWSKVTGAKQYTVYVATSQNGTYKKLGTSKSTSYTDSKAKAGTTYFYKVIANASKSAYNSGYSNIVFCGVICGTPSVTVKVDANTGKPSLSWKKVDGATKYAIYRDGELLTTTTAVTYADTGAAIDTQYTYTVQAVGKTENLNGNLSKAVTATSGIAKPTVKGSLTALGQPQLSWNAVEGAVKYEIYRSTKSSKGYALVGTAEELTYTEKSASVGKTYYYQVKAVGEVSKSANSSYVKLTGKCATPEISVDSNAKGQPVISWSKISGAKKYTVYRSTSENSGYKSIGTSKTTSYTDTKASAGKVYYYKVVANASSSKYNSGYSNIVSCGVKCATPVVKISNNASGAPVISWSKVTGAVKYKVMYMDATDYLGSAAGPYADFEEHHTEAYATGTSFTIPNAESGRFYMVSVVAVAADGNFSSEGSEPVFADAIPATPKLTGKVGANKKPVLSWAEVDGAYSYVIYRSTSKSKGYKVIDETESLTYEDLTAAKGKTYYYKIVAVGNGVESAQSSYVKVKSK